jgi:hypothetical protein
VLILIQFLHHLRNSVLHFLSLLLNCYVLHTHRMRVDYLPLGTLKLLLQTLDLLEQLLVVALLCLNVLF